MSFNATNNLVNNWGMGVEGAIPDKWFNEINHSNFKILEVGFGKGNMLKRLEEGNNPELHGLDASQVNYRYAKGENNLNASLIYTYVTKRKVRNKKSR